MKELYEKLKDECSINKAFIDRDDSLKLLINNEINSYKEVKE